MISARLALILLALPLVGCVSEPVKPEVRTVTNTVVVPTPVPCFDPADLPKLPKPAPVDVATASTDQLAAAAVADVEAYELYARTVDAMWAQCLKQGVKK